MNEEIEKIRREYKFIDEKLKEIEKNTKDGHFEGSLKCAEQTLDFYKGLIKRMSQYTDEFEDELKELEKYASKSQQQVEYCRESCAKARLAENRFRFRNLRGF